MEVFFLYRKIFNYWEFVLLIKHRLRHDKGIVLFLIQNLRYKEKWKLFSFTSFPIPYANNKIFVSDTSESGFCLQKEQQYEFNWGDHSKAKVFLKYLKIRFNESVFCQSYMVQRFEFEPIRNVF